ncbi:type III pantothenate kinase [Mucisphaera calidilacus]|uniref:Type III pantothenate kinase n=1 Tax=Mucisphaera calidilacus TaxID=2527982 RepID=A0A518BY78_9BACT|nr:type III pantothenate kinase [Mucisphaera calidilacus]QDU71933.1 Type III pantothenate kinase [Mucisphaera calidilacus]
MTRANLLAVSVGNTRTRVGAYVDGKLVESATFINERHTRVMDSVKDAARPLRDHAEAPVVMSSVNPAVSSQMETELQGLGRPLYRVERDLPIPIGRQLDPEALVGEDRLLNAAGAFDVLKQAAVIVDAGTAMTVDLVDGAGTFHGGAILPGAQLMLDSLTQRTALLPEVELSRPTETVGHSTVEAMLSGVYYGQRGAVRELVERFADAAGQYPLVVATGGDADLLFREWDLVDRIVPDLTLMGLEVTLRVALERGREES